MKLFVFILGGLLSLGWIFPPLVPAQPSPAKGLPQAYLRYLCASEGNVPPKVFGEWPQFQPPRRLAVEGGPAGPLLLASQLLPLSSAGYQPMALAPGKIVMQELSAAPADKTPPKTLASLNFQPKAGRFYTLLIRGEGAAQKLDLLEDEPAGVPPSKDGEEPPPPRRSLRCLVLEPGLQVKIASPEAGIQLAAGPDKPVVAENLRKGLWNLELAGENKGQVFTTSVELDLEASGNWTLFFMKDIYGRVAPTLKKDASLD
jgi:hypothetical protein